MKTLVLYDSAYGNTEKIARSIGSAIEGEIVVQRIAGANPAAIEGADFLFIGCPTQGGRPTKTTLEFINRIPESALPKMKAATYDTRLTNRLAGIFGYAAEKLGANLKSKGATIVSSSGFFVTGSKGPLKEGELQRAAAWAAETVKRLTPAKA
jgi:flavodoxin I